jgi:hypothetical protein
VKISNYTTVHGVYSLILTCITEQIKQIIDVGKALKKVDRTLLQEWAQWSAKCLSFQTAIILWDAFEPKACDVHHLYYSQVCNRPSFRVISILSSLKATRY